LALGSRKQQPKDNPEWCLWFRCLDNQGGKLSLFDFVALGRSQNNGPPKPGGGPMGAHYFTNARLAQAHCIAWCKKSMDFRRLKFVFSPPHDTRLITCRIPFEGIKLGM